MARKEDYDDTTPETVVGASVKIEGDLTSEGNIKVEGQVVGKIKTDRNLFVGPMAKIEADVEAANAVIAGMVKGELKIKENLLVAETGKIAGNLTCVRLSIAEGAHFTGSATMPEPEEGLNEPLPEEE
jgi:cytoskeletal protein CcmA (bactofilin family)